MVRVFDTLHDFKRYYNRDLLHLIKNTFDRKRIYDNPTLILTLTLTLTLKRNYIFGLTK